MKLLCGAALSPCNGTTANTEGNQPVCDEERLSLEIRQAVCAVVPATESVHSLCIIEMCVECMCVCVCRMHAALRYSHKSLAFLHICASLQIHEGIPFDPDPFCPFSTFHLGENNQTQATSVIKSISLHHQKGTGFLGLHQYTNEGIAGMNLCHDSLIHATKCLRVQGLGLKEDIEIQSYLHLSPEQPISDLVRSSRSLIGSLIENNAVIHPNLPPNPCL